MPLRPKKAIERRTLDGLTDGALSWFWWGGTLSAGPGYEWGKGRAPEEIRKFWKKHRREILAWFIEKNRLRKGEPGRRPEFFWDEIEAEKPRKKTGVEKWTGPVRPDGGNREMVDAVFETDAEYLARLNLLEKWEEEIIGSEVKK